MEFDGFDWDEGNWPKCGRHGVSREEIEEVLAGQQTLVFPDIVHSGLEVREIAIGMSLKAGRLVAIFFTRRVSDLGVLLRPFSARYMHDKEVRKYEQTRPRQG